MNTTKRLTKELVHDAAKRLDADGKKPSAVNVRDALGFGSYSTIIKHLAEYSGEEIEGPDEIPEAPAETIATIWRLAYTAAWQLTQQGIEELNARLEQYHGTFDELSDVITVRDSQITDLYNELAGTNIELVKTCDKNSALLKQNEKLSIKAETLAAQLAETNAERDRLFELVQKRMDLEPETPAPKRRAKPSKTTAPVEKQT